MAGEFEQVGVEAVIEGLQSFFGDADSFNEAIGSFGDTADDAASGLDAASEIMTGALRAIGEAAVNLAMEAGSALVGFLSDSFQGALEAEQNMARLGQVIESTGGIAGVTVNDAKALADQFKGLAGGSDDAVISIIDMGLRMGTISEEEMPAFIQSTLDLGAVMGDASKAAQLMARAQEDPVGVLGALRKAGILVNEETEAQIKAMVKSGDTAGAYALLMDRVGEATAGAAETMAETTAGQWQIFTETIADAGESIMGAFLPAITAIAGPILDSVVPAIETFAGVISVVIEDLLGGDAGLAFDDFREGLFSIGAAIGIPQESIRAFNDVLTQVWNYIQANIPLIQSTFEQVFTAVQDVINNVLVPAVQSIVNWVVANWPMIQATAESVWGAVQAAFNMAVEFINGLLASFLPQITANIQTTLTGLTAFWQAHGAEIMAIVETTFQVIAASIAITLAIIGTTLSSALTLFSGLIATTMQIINGDWEGAWQTIQDTIATVLDGILSLVGSDLDSFIDTWTGTFDLAVTIVTQTMANILAAISDGLNSAIGAAQAIVTGFVDVGAAMISGMISGISGAVGGLVSAAVDAALSAFNAAKEALGISSPSKLAADLIGKPFSQGIALGIGQGVGAIESASVGAASTALIAGASTISTVNNYNYAPTYGASPRSPSTDFALMQVMAI